MVRVIGEKERKFMIKHKKYKEKQGIAHSICTNQANGQG